MDRTATAIAVALALLLMAAVVGEPPAPGAGSLPPAPDGYEYYQVRRGETLFRIAQAHGVSVEELARLNGLEDPNLIQAGQILLVPRRSAAGWQGPVSAAMAVPWPAEPGVSGERRSWPPPPMDPAAVERARQMLAQLSDRELLARIIWLEARGEPLEGQVAVGAVVLNRVKTPGFPKTVAAVLAQPGQFGFTAEEIVAAVPGPTAYAAADRALAGEDPTGGALFFYNPEKTLTPEFWARREALVRIGRHVFAR